MDRLMLLFLSCIKNHVSWGMQFVRQECSAPLPHLFDDDLAVLVNGTVVNHAHYGHAQVTPDTEGDAETQSAHDGDDVAARQTEAPTVAQRGLLFRGLPGPPILRQLDHIPCFLFPLYHPATARWGQHCLLSVSVKWWVSHRVAQQINLKFLPWWKMRPVFISMCEQPICIMSWILGAWVVYFKFKWRKCRKQNPYNQPTEWLMRPLLSTVFFTFNIFDCRTNERH